MSGICGVVGLNGRAPAADELDPTLEVLKARGPDAFRVWHDQNIILGHTLLTTTREAAVEQLPLHHPESRCTITADARLDNRDELFAALGVPPGGRTIGDGELILRAYLRWGEDCPGHLLGDFAFAIWDGRRRRLFCARDQMGMRQLSYAYLPGRAFVFATEPRAVVHHSLIPKQLNEGRVADFLDNLERSTLTETFYRGVHRLPPAHTLVADESGLSVERYWRLSMPAQLRLKTDEGYVEAFLDTFRAAVGSRLRSANGVGSMLSGGMDSGSVSAIAAEILKSQGRGPLATYSVALSDPATSMETLGIYESSQMPGLDPRIIRVEEMTSYRDEIIELTRNEEEPFDCHMGLFRMIYRAASRDGVKVVLDGGAGDLLVSGATYMTKLARRGNLLTLWREARATANFWNLPPPALSLFGRSLWTAWAPSPAVAGRRRLAWWLNDLRSSRSGRISKQLIDRARLNDRRRKTRLDAERIGALDDDQRAQSISQAILTVGRERYDRVAASFGVEPRDPFMDLRLIDFCLSLPWKQLQSGGWPKILLRRAMAGKLPDSVRWRRGMDHLGFQVMKEIFGSFSSDDLDREQIRNVLAPHVTDGHLPIVPPDWSEPRHCKEWVDALCLNWWLQKARRTLER
ncbi:asparagine synthase-related protein [Sphingomonas hankyongi]|uniref:asparagine synthase (glutamine-hydrolyzing) n=1 Tax=Sphingomonas hankyongi TaxID=2908209 RepID=A0ABT0S2W3_9SPHN|nr:asparagine synthase-related protein [Sphingomonas hankyongi]MCL6730137.1 asparagine synthase-related protein [Sphingomonas hankyongi]